MSKASIVTERNKFCFNFCPRERFRNSRSVWYLESPVSWRRRVALRARMMGAYVSGRAMMEKTRKAIPTIETLQNVPEEIKLSVTFLPRKGENSSRSPFKGQPCCGWLYGMLTSPGCLRCNHLTHYSHQQSPLTSTEVLALWTHK